MKKLAIISGVAYILAWVIGLVLASGGRRPNDPAAKVASYSARHEHTASLGHLFVGPKTMRDLFVALNNAAT